MPPFFFFLRGNLLVNCGLCLRKRGNRQRCHGYCVDSENSSTLFQNRVKICKQKKHRTVQSCRRRIQIRLLLFPVMWKKRDLFSYDPITWIMADRLLCLTGEWKHLVRSVACCGHLFLLCSSNKHYSRSCLSKRSKTSLTSFP